MHDMSYLGTIKKNKREIPPRLLAVRNREVKSSQFAFQADVTVVSYKYPTKKKKVLLISTLHHDNKIDPDSGESLKLDMITFYNRTTGTGGE
ncbi:hypothetical protein NQ314_020775 [Rhamnusium bicolor]|uniref:PiggyBac transposable element-derived protein domain-containing protein n=1 Tax=Rhamnusium bicolor TaxID=1586634 RepID=A0AAV8WKS2_9CUCU|nr:hypothetical protein NQ314_020775 [Rhamnusium bicolor]